jgi:hypothetical protein
MNSNCNWVKQYKEEMQKKEGRDAIARFKSMQWCSVNCAFSWGCQIHYRCYNLDKTSPHEDI